MFGYVTICEPELKVKDLRKYRAYYCGLCRTLKERFGGLGQLTLTYDMTFAVILLTSLYAVSYTHLDVYKRQNLKRRRAADACHGKGADEPSEDYSDG